MTLRGAAGAALVSVLLTLAGAAEAQAQRNQARAAAQVQRAITFVAEPGEAAGSLVLPVAAETDLAARAAGLAAEERAAISRAIASARFEYGTRETLSLRGLGGWDRILVVGLGENTSTSGYQRAGAIAGRALLDEPGAVTVMAAGLDGAAVAEFAAGMGIGEYRSDLFQAARRDAAPLGPTAFVTDAPDAAGLYAERGRALVEAMAWTRDISNEPANVVYPESFVARARAAFARTPGVSIQVLDVPAMERLGMGALTGVGRGSARPPRMLIVRYRGQGAPAQPIVLAGKGITFDSGGLSLKDPSGMGNMRMDMSGAASVTGAVLALARARAPVNVIAIAALAENMPDGAAIRPGDRRTAKDGKTMEIA